MARRSLRRALAMRPVVYTKNIVDSTTIGVAAGTTTQTVVAAATNTYAGAVTEVPIGAKLQGIYVFFQIQPQAAQGNVDMYIAKGPNAFWAANPVPGATGGDPGRKFILHEEKGIPGTFNNGASPLTFRGFIKIPRGRKSFQEGDIIKICYRCATAYDACLKVIYKWYQ